MANDRWIIGSVIANEGSRRPAVTGSEQHMARKKPASLSPDALAAARERAVRARQQFAHKPRPEEFLTSEERADAARFYFVLREFIRQLKQAREAAGLTLAEVAARSGLAVESLSRLETGALTNPTWKTLGLYAVAVGCRPVLSAERAETTEPSRRPVEVPNP